MTATRRDVLALCVQKAGWREGRKVAQFIVEWEMAAASHGRKISADEFAAYWKDHRATAFRRLDRFRQAFPELGEHGKPDDLMTIRARAAEEPSIDLLLDGVVVT